MLSRAGLEARLAVLVGLCALLSACGPAPALPTPPPTAPHTITVVMDNNYPPYSFLDSAGQSQGILIDEWELWEQKTGVAVELHALPWGEALTRMEAGEFDVIDTIFYNPTRAQIYDFTEPYATLEVPIFFYHEISGITDAESLRDFPVAVKSGDNAIEVLKRHGVEQLVEFDSYEAIVQAAKDYRVGLFVVDKPPALYFLYKLGIQDKFNFTAPLYTGHFHRAVKKGNAELLNLIEAGFAKISVAEYAALESKWYGSTSVISPAVWRFLGLGAGAGLALLLGLAVWNYALQKTVAQRTAEVKASEQRLRTIFDSVNDAIFVQDLAKGAILDVNRKALEMYGYTAEEVQHLTVEMLSSGEPPYTQTEALGWLRKAAAGEPQLFEWRAKHRAGHLFWVEVNMRRAEVGGHDRVLVAVRDISERKQAEAELALAHAETAAALQQATGLAQQAQEANQLKSEFLANISHELRTPITIIISSLRLVLDGVYDSAEEASEFVQIAHTASQNLHRLINDVLDLAKIEAGRAEVEIQPVDLRPLFTEIYDLWRAQAEQKQLHLSLQWPASATPLLVHADRDKLSQILINLVGNAIKFTAQGAVVLSAEPQPASGHMLIEVQDTGIGVPTDKQARLFQPFVQADGTTTRKYGGTGLGLSLSRRLAELMGGQLTLHSAGEGRGATLRLRLPLADSR